MVIFFCLYQILYKINLFRNSHLQDMLEQEINLLFVELA